MVLCWWQLLLQLSSVSVTLCGPLKQSRTVSLLWTVDQDLRVFYSIHGPRFTPRWTTSLLRSPRLPFQRERDTMKEHARHSESTWLWPPPPSAGTVWANINWVWTSMKDTANSHLNVCIWTILRGAGSWRAAMLVFAEYNTSSRFCIVSFQRSISSGRRQGACLFVYRALSPLSTTQMHPSVSRHDPPPLPTYQFTQFTKSRLSYLLNKY